VPEVLAPLLVDFDAGRDLPEIEEAEKLLDASRLATHPAGGAVDRMIRRKRIGPRTP
jgi:hypothetical protein